MSVEGGSSIGTGAGISAGVSSGGFSAEIGGSSFSSSSFSASQAEVGGGFSPNMTIDNLFSNTIPFIASEGPSFDRLIGNPDSIFSQKSDFSTIVKSAESPKLDSVDNLFKDTIPFVPVSETFSERVSLKDAREILADTIKSSSADLKEREWVSISRPKEQNQEEVIKPQEVQLEIPQEDMAQAKRVADILVSLGTEKEEAIGQVLEIVRKMNSQYENIGQITLEMQDPDIQEQVEAETIIAGKKRAILAVSEENQEDEEVDEEEEKKKKKKKKPQAKKQESTELVLEVDESAQASRKSTILERLSKAFQNAREKGLSVVRGNDVVSGISEKKQDKSDLLIQAGYENVSDGSFQEVADIISKFEFNISSNADEESAEAVVNSIIGGKPAVRISETVTSKPVSKEDEKRVMKFVNSPLPIIA